MLAGMIFIMHPLFRGRDNFDQLVKIVKVLGTDSLNQYLSKYKLKLDSHFDDIMGTYQRRDWRIFITKKNRHLVTEEALDLLSNLLVFDHQKRLTCEEAMQHEYFAPIREQEKKAVAKGGEGNDESKESNTQKIGTETCTPAVADE
jgi:casein kinase II subunit alpha